MNIIITGGFGCIASETRKILQKASSVQKIVLLSRQKRSLSDSSGKCLCEQVNLKDQTAIGDLLKKYQITHVFHTAAIRTSEAQEKPAEAFDINVNYTTNILEACRNYGKIKRVVFISTAAVYGDVDDEIDESAPTTAHLTYIATKLAAEKVCECYANSYGLQTIVIRPQILYGPSRLSEGSTASVSHALVAAAKNENFCIQFSGPHSFHFTEDVGKFFGDAIMNDNGKIYEVYNLPGESFRCREFADLLEKHSESHIEVIENTLPFPTKVNADKFLKDYPDHQCTSLEQSVLDSLAEIRKDLS
jgi:nucleoside-diphosphate-sugar epimerase